MTEFSIDICTDGWSKMDKSSLMARHFARDLTAVPFHYSIDWHVPGVTIDYTKRWVSRRPSCSGPTTISSKPSGRPHPQARWSIA